MALLTAGNRMLTATYQGDANYNASPASTGAAHTVNKADTTASITSDNPDPSVVGQQIAVTYSVAVNAPGSGTPTGNVLVSDGVDSATGTVAAGSVNITLNTPGNRTLTATYQGDANYNASPASTGAPHTVNQPPAFTNGPPPTPVVVGTPYNFTYTASGFPSPTFSVTPGSLPTNLVLSSTGAITGTPTVAGTFTGTVTASNGVAPAATQAFNIKINGPPVVSTFTVVSNEDSTLTFVAAFFTSSYSDPNSDPLATVRITSLPANGVLKLSGVNITTVPTDIPIGNIGTLTYVPPANYNGLTAFNWNGSDGMLFATSSATVNLSITAVNDKPIFTAANPPAVNKNAGAQTVVAWVTGFNPGPADEAGQTVLGYPVSNVGNPALFSVQPAVAANGTLTYTPSGTTSGTSTFQVRVQDSGGTAFGGIDLSDAQTFTITVNANSNPVANPDTSVRYPSQSVKVLLSTLLSNDTDADLNTLTLTSVSAPAPAGAAVTQDGTWVYYTPLVGSTNAGSFIYSISDGQGGTANGLVTVNIIVDNSTAQNITKIETLGDGSKRITFGGIPGRTYRVQSTDSFAPANWVDRATVPADALGQFQFTDPPLLPLTRFYRSVSP